MGSQQQRVDRSRFQQQSESSRRPSEIAEDCCRCQQCPTTSIDGSETQVIVLKILGGRCIINRLYTMFKWSGLHYGILIWLAFDVIWFMVINDTMSIRELPVSDRRLQEGDSRHPVHGQRPARNSFLDSTKQDARTTLWVEEWNALGERSTERRSRGFIPNERLINEIDELWSTWRSLNRLRV